MATENRRKNLVIKKLVSQPEGFNFFQAVRLLHYYFNGFGKKPVGHHYLPEEEGLKFKAVNSFAFSPGSIKRIQQNEKTHEFTLEETFLGLTGALGVLPEHYTET